VARWPPDFATGPAPPPQPLPRDSARTVLAVDGPAIEVWLRRNYLEAYDRVGVRDPRWDEAARRFISVSMGAIGGLPETVSLEERRAMGAELVGRGCADPVVLYLQGRHVFRRGSDFREATELFERAVAGFRHVKYSRAVGRQAVSDLIRDYDNSNEGLGLRGGTLALERQWFEASLRDGSYEADEDAVLVYDLHRGTAFDLMEREPAAVTAALERVDWIDAWVKRLAAGELARDTAWKARGTGLASEVKPEAWPVFRRANAEARKTLLKAWNARPDRPEVATLMIPVADDLPVHGETMRTWFDRAVAARLDYMPAYRVLMSRLLPRWGGSYEEMFALGRQAAETRRFDTDVPFMLVRAVQYIDADQREPVAGIEGKTVYEWPETYPLLASVLEGYTQEPTRATRRRYYESLQAIVANKAGRHAEARELLRRLDHRLDPQATSLFEVDPRTFATELARQAGPAATEATAGEAAWASRDLRRVVALLGQARSKESDPEARAHFADRVAAARLEQQLDGGGWVRFVPEGPDVAGWEPQLGAWTVENGVLVGTSGSRGLLIVSQARVGPDFEMQGRLKLMESTNGEYQGGPVFGRPSWKSWEWTSFRIKRNRGEGNVAYFAHYLMGPGHETRPLAQTDEYTFHVTCWRGRLSAAVDGTVIVRGHDPGLGYVSDSDAQVGFGGYYDNNRFKIAFRDVRLRRLMKQPDLH
jgi:hypothetical protein